MVDALRPRFSIAAFVAQTKAEAAAHPGIPITPRVSTTQTPADRAQLKAEHEDFSRRSVELKRIVATSRASRPLDVSAMRPDQAEARLAQLTLMRKHGGIEHMGINVTRGGETTKSLDTLMEWLAERAGHAKTPPAPGTLVNTTA